MGGLAAEVQPLWRPFNNDSRAPLAVSDIVPKGGVSSVRRGYNGKFGGRGGDVDINGGIDNVDIATTPVSLEEIGGSDTGGLQRGMSRKILHVAGGFSYHSTTLSFLLIL